MPKRYQPIGLCMAAPKTELGRFLRRSRLAVKKSQVEVAKFLRVSRGTYQGYEGGRLRTVTEKKAAKLAQILECDIEKIKELGLRE